IIDRLKRTDLTDYNNLNLLFETCRLVIEEDLDFALETSEIVKNKAASLSVKDIRFFELYNRALLLQSPYLFDSFLLYIEKNRKPEARFYLPRRNSLMPIVKAFQAVADGKLDFLSVSQPKRTGKTTLGLSFILFLSGKRPDKASLAIGQGDDLVSSFYEGCNGILNNPEYSYFDVFPNATVDSRNADKKTINLEGRSRFATITCRAIDGQIVGSTEATNLLYFDDLVSGYEEAMNRNRLDKLWAKVSGDAMGRRIEGTPIIAQGTRYSLYDPIGQLQDHADEMGWKWQAIEIPALNEEKDESNFSIFIEGKERFSTDFYRAERNLISEEQWESEFQQHPFESKGLMLPEAELNRYFELPPDIDPDAIITVCDTAESGSDSCSMPIAYIYGEDVFIEDVVFDNSPSDVTKPQCAKKIVEHKVSTAVFESNNAGKYFAKDVNTEVTKLGGKVSIREKTTISNKLTRIEYAADGIKKHFYFKHKSLYKPSSQYGRFMKEVITMTRTGKVPHDDAPDSLSLLENEIRRLKGNQVTVFKRPC
ncbi:MAG TPA: phage terminase large subunit, partial [Clostridia bacterium]|nr:phage terminase large subunit [Clostridia bacterium]